MPAISMEASMAAAFMAVEDSTATAGIADAP
jgi:hypothetical protein